MSTRLTGWAGVVGMALLIAASARASQSAPLLQDLTALIALHGQSCGQVVTAVRQSDSDYLASCEDGKRYRVFMSAAGRVVVEKQ